MRTIELSAQLLRGLLKISRTLLVISIFETNSCLKLPLVVIILNSKAIFVIAASLAPFFW